MNSYERQKRANDAMNPAPKLDTASEGNTIVISAKRYEVVAVTTDGGVWARKIDRNPGDSMRPMLIQKEYLQAAGYKARE